MQALRSGFKRIDNQKSRGKGSKPKQIDPTADESVLPILTFQDSNESSSTTTWEEPMLQEDDTQPLSSELTPIDINRFTTSDSTSPNLKIPHKMQPLAEYNENVPPNNNYSVLKGRSLLKWKQVADSSESRLPLLTQSATNSSTTASADRLIYSPKKSSGWQTIEDVKPTGTFNEKSVKHGIEITSQRHTTKFDIQEKRYLHEKIDRPNRIRCIDNPVLQTSVPKVHSSVGFGMLSNREKVGAQQSCVINHHSHLEPIGNSQKNPFESSNMNCIQQNNNKYENLQRSKATLEQVKAKFFRNFEGDFFSSSEDILNRSHDLNVDGKHPPEYNFAESFSMEGLAAKKFPLEENKFTSKEDSLVSNPYEMQETLFPIDSLMVGSTKIDTRNRLGDEENAYDESQINCSKETLPCVPHEEKELSLHTTNNEIYTNDEILNDVGYIANNESTERRTSGKSTDESICSRQEMPLYSTNDENYTNDEVLNDVGYISNDKSTERRKSGMSTDESICSRHSSEQVQTYERNVNTSLSTEVGKGLRLVVLFSEFSSTLKQRTEQQRTIAILNECSISNIERVDGSSLCNKVRRNRLFEISGEKGKYPQFFLQKDQNIIIHLGDFEWLQYMNDIGTLTDETIFGESHSKAAKDDKTSIYFINEEAESLDHNSKVLNDSHLTRNCDSTSAKNADNNDPGFQNNSSSSKKVITDGSTALTRAGVLVQTSPTAPEMNHNQYSSQELENEPEFDGASQILTQSLTSSMKSQENTTDRQKSYRPPTACPTTCDNKYDIIQEDSQHPRSVVDTYSNYLENENKEETCSKEILHYRENKRDTCSEFDKPEVPKVGTSDQKRKENEAKRRERWKRQIIAENLRTQSSNGHSSPSSERVEKPIGASLSEIEMLNIFLAVLGPNFARFISERELDDLYHRSRKVGLPEEFINRMLDQSAGIVTVLQEDKDLATEKPSNVHNFQVKTSLGSTSFQTDAYDDHEFTRKTPKESSKINCLVDSLFPTSPNVEDDDIFDNLRAALSANTDSNRGLRSTISDDSGDSKNMWSSSIQYIKASLSGESSERGWRSSSVIEGIKSAFSTDSENSIDMIGSMKAAFSKDSENSIDMIQSIKAAFSNDSENSIDMIQSIKAAFSKDSENSIGLSTSVNPNKNAQVESNAGGKYERKNSGELSSQPVVATAVDVEDAYGNTTLHEC